VVYILGNIEEDLSQNISTIDKKAHEIKYKKIYNLYTGNISKAIIDAIIFFNKKNIPCDKGLLQFYLLKDKPKLSGKHYKLLEKTDIRRGGSLSLKSNKLSEIILTLEYEKIIRRVKQGYVVIWENYEEFERWVEGSDCGCFGLSASFSQDPYQDVPPSVRIVRLSKRPNQRNRRKMDKILEELDNDTKRFFS
jgi:hypothetical protein